MLVPGSTNPLFLQEQLGLRPIDIPRTAQFFNEGARLTRTPTQKGSSAKFTVSMWVKRGKIGSGRYGLLAAGEIDEAAYTALEFVDDHLVFTCKGQINGGDSCTTAAVYVDTSAFYQIVLNVNTNFITPSRRLQIYVNGVYQDFIDPETNFIDRAAQTLINRQKVEMMVGASRDLPILEEKKYNTAQATLGLVYLLDSKYEGVNRFGQYDKNEVWQNKLYDGSYGRNGARLLDFSKGTPIGKDAQRISDFFPHNLPDTNVGNGNWVSQIVTTGGPKNDGVYPIRNAFDGGDVQGASGVNSTSTWSTNIAFTNKFEVIINGSSTTPAVRFYWGDGPTDYYDYTPQVATPTKDDITSNVQSPITKVTWTTPDSNGPFFRGFFADDVQLIDNGFNQSVICSDSPTDGYSFRDTGNGNQFPSNYAVYNPTNIDLKEDNGSFKKGNRDIVLAPGTRSMARGSFSVSSGKWWWEVVFIGGKSGTMGISDSTKSASEVTGLDHNLVFRAEDGKIQGNLARAAGAPSSFGPEVELEMFDRIGFALDMDNGNLGVYKNNVFIAYANSTSLLGKSVIPHLGHTGADSTNYQTITLFGEEKHRDQAPSGYKSLASGHVQMTFPNGRKAFDYRRWTGFLGSSANEITYNMTPSIVWIRPIQAGSWYEVDRLRGTEKVIFVNTPNNETDNVVKTGTKGITEFTDKGFKLGNLPANGLCNNIDTDYIGYAWDMGKQENQNTDGDIDSTTLVHQAAGLSLIKYIGNGLRNQKVGHGLNVQPTVFWTKCTTGGRNVWGLWSSHIVDYDGTGGVKRLYFNSNQKARVRAGMYSTLTGDPVDADCIYVDHQNEDRDLSNNSNKQTHIACAFTPVKNFSSFGSFTIGASNQEFPFILTNFSPSFIIIKNQTSDKNWIVVDNSRPGYNEDSKILELDNADAEQTNTPIIHFLSNGFQLAGKQKQDPKLEDDIYFYMAFAANPFFTNGGISR